MIVAVHDDFRENAADEFDHAVSYTSDAVDGNDFFSFINAMVGGKVVLVHLGSDLRLGRAICRGIDDQKTSGKETEDEDRHG